MEANLEFQENSTQSPGTQSEKDLVIARYNFLLSEQPSLQVVEPQRLITALSVGCISTIIPIYMDTKEPFQDTELLSAFAVGCFLIGAIITHVIGQIMNDRNNKKALVQNLEMLQGWTRPIIILPETRFDRSMDARAREITDILQDDKCLNQLNIGLENAEMSFEYSIEYGFRKGEKCQTNVGLPIVSLFPELFILRGAFDDRLWYEFQQEAVRIALEIDSEFAKSWFTLENEKYRIVAGGQFIG
jgi:hypothetical protein